jgi:polyhydroxybutyrate depolymerase
MRRAGIVWLVFSACHTPDPGTARAKTPSGRTYLVHAPSAANPAHVPRPLLILLHGRYGNGVVTEEHSRLSALADREGFVVVYPDGIDRSWHDRREQGPAAEAHVDDVAFISSLIDTMVREESVDPKRVYVAGISNGAMMTFRLACELSEKIAAVGAVIGALPENGAQDCKPSHPMPLVMFSGTEDPLVPYAGGEVKGHRGRVLSADATRARFAELGNSSAVSRHDEANALFDDLDRDLRIGRPFLAVELSGEGSAARRVVNRELDLRSLEILRVLDADLIQYFLG